MADWNDTKFLMQVKCPKCNSNCVEDDSQTYICSRCAYEEPTDYGKVRTYLEENGNSSAMEIARGTGIAVGKINAFLRSGRLEIPENSEVYISCKRCGTDIRYGKYCPECAAELKKELQEAFDIGSVGAVPKKQVAKMQFLDRDICSRHF